MTEQTDTQDNTEFEPLDVVRIMEMIPHRYPLLLVDRIIQFEAGKSATGLKNVTMNGPHFEGHFPVVSGDAIHLHVEVIRSRGTVWKFKGTAKVDGKLCAEATFSAMIMDR